MTGQGCPIRTDAIDFMAEDSVLSLDGKEPVAMAEVDSHSGTDEHQPSETDEIRSPNTVVRRTGTRERVRFIIACVIAVVAVILVAVTVPTVWLKTTIMDTDQWVNTVAPLADSPAIQKVVADTASTALVDSLDIEGVVENNLPEQGQPLAAPLASTIESAITQQAENLVASPAFSNLWRTMNSNAHDAIVATLTGTGDGGAVSSTDGTVSVDVGVVVDSVQDALVDRGFDFVKNIPIDSIDQQIVLFSSPSLAKVQTALKVLQEIAGMLVFITLALIALAVAVAPGRKRRGIVVWLGMGTFIVTLLSILVINFVQTPLMNAMPDLDSAQKAAVAAAYGTLSAPLIVQERVVALVGLVVAIVAAVVGHSTVKGKMDGLLVHAVGNEGMAKFSRLVERYRMSLTVGGFVVVGVLLLFQSQPTWELLTGFLVGLVIWIALVWGISSLAGVAKTDHDAAETS